MLTIVQCRPEVFTTELRAKANAIVQVVHYSISLIITQCSPIALAAVGWKYYILFILTNALCACVFIFAYPETRGKSTCSASLFVHLLTCSQAALWRRLMRSSATSISCTRRM